MSVRSVTSVGGSTQQIAGNSASSVGITDRTNEDADETKVPKPKVTPHPLFTNPTSHTQRLQLLTDR